MDIQSTDKKHLGREGVTQALTVKRTQDSYIYDEAGKRFIDFYMGWCVGNIGWNVDEVVQAIKDFNGPTYVSPNYFYKEWAELAEILANIAPGKLTKSFRATGGTEAVEIALQAAMFHTKRSGFISIEGSYHGHSIGAMSVGMSDFREWYRNLLPDCHKVKPPLNKVAAQEVEKILSKGNIAAFISEPVICNAGVVIPDKEFFDIVQAACKKYGTLFIADEVATGFGRTGKMFACEHYNIKPDIMCVAKGLSGGFGAIGAALMTAEVAKTFEFDFSFYSTFGWHPLSVTATIAALKHLTENKEKIFDNASKLSAYFESRLKKMKFQYPAEIQIKGLAIGLEFNRADYNSEIIKRCRERGLLIANAGSTNIVMYPALSLDMETAKEGLGILEACLSEA